MAFELKTAAIVDNLENTIFTADKDYVIFGMTIAPTSGVYSTFVDVKINGVFFLRKLIILNGSTIAPIGDDVKIAFPTGTPITIQASDNVDVTLSLQG